MSLSVKEISDEEYGHCAVLTAEDCEVIVTLDYGPRIVSVRSKGMKNLIDDHLDDEYDRRHGHKMRITLDTPTNGIYCDDMPVRYSPLEDGVSFVQTITSPIQLELTMDVVFDTDFGDLMIVHGCLNKSGQTAKLSIYTETPYANDGCIFVPLSNIPEQNKPGMVLSLWGGAKWTDGRIHLGDNYLAISPTVSEHDKGRLKIGSNNTAGWSGYSSGRDVMIKRYVHNRTALYPFFSCSTFATSCSGHMSIQTTSPFYVIGPGESCRLIESWCFGTAGNDITASDEASIDEFVNSGII